MWIISFLPEYVVHLIFTFGVLGVLLGFVLGFLPFIRPYKIPVQIVSLVILCLGVYLQGALADYKEWELKAKEFEAKISKMQQEIAQAETKVVEKIVVKTQVIREKGQEIIKYVDREVVKYDTKFMAGGECELPSDFYRLYNESLGIEKK